MRIFGQTPLGQQGLHTALAIEDPAEFAARSLRGMLLARGVQVSGKARAQHRPPVDTSDFLPAQQQAIALHSITLRNVQSPAVGQNMLASHVSAPLGDDLVVTNKVSQNLHAEITLRTLGKLEGSDGSLLEGTRVVRQFLITAGVIPTDFVIYDGCGLSVQDLVTPRAFTTLLSYAARQSWGDAFRSSLPVGGVDGSLSSRFKQPLLDGKVFAKTGTLGEARALSGYLVAASGQTVVFSIMCTDHSPSLHDDRFYVVPGFVTYCFDEQRRQRQHRRGDARLIGGQRENDRRRRVGARGQHIGERAAHQRRRIVEQHQHGALGGTEIVGRQIGIEEGARQCAGRFGPLASRSGAYPLEKMADDHCWFTQHGIIAAAILKRLRLTKRSP